jgi:hypothetical protein
MDTEEWQPNQSVEKLKQIILEKDEKILALENELASLKALIHLANHKLDDLMMDNDTKSKESPMKLNFANLIAHNDAPKTERHE